MIAFEITLNGKRLCTSGIRQLGNLGAHLDWSRGPQVGPATGFEHEDELLQLTVAGVNVRYKPRKSPQLKRGFRYAESLEWTACKLRSGDEVTIRVVNVARVDRPRKRKVLR